jgi:hypothetical protein
MSLPSSPVEADVSHPLLSEFIRQESNVETLCVKNNNLAYILFLEVNPSKHRRTHEFSQKTIINSNTYFLTINMVNQKPLRVTTAKIGNTTISSGALNLEKPPALIWCRAFQNRHAVGGQVE